MKLLSEKKEGEDIIKNKLLYKYMIPLNGFGGKCDINVYIYILFIFNIFLLVLFLIIILIILFT